MANGKAMTVGEMASLFLDPALPFVSTLSTARISARQTRI